MHYHPFSVGHWKEWSIEIREDVSVPSNRKDSNRLFRKSVISGKSSYGKCMLESRTKYFLWVYTPNPSCVDPVHKNGLYINLICIWSYQQLLSTQG
jgi:hypothetical protein